MKRKISLFLVIVMLAGALVGCNLIERNYEKDYGRDVAVIKSQTLPFDVDKPDYDQYGLLIYDNQGFVKTTKKSYTYTSAEVRITKAQLNNYVLNMINDKLNNGKSVEDSVDEILKDVIEYYVTLIEADRLFYAGEIYWTQADIDEIQRAVYSSIDDELFSIRNELLAADNKETVTKPAGEEASTETTYPVMPEESIKEEKTRPMYYYYNEESDSFKWSYSEPVSLTYQWHDEWYTADEWYIQDEDKYLTAYPGIFGSEDQISLEKEALNNYISDLGDKFKSYVEQSYLVVSDAEYKIVQDELAEIENIKNTLGVQYVYPMLGRTLLMKFLVGDNYIKSAKSQKFQTYIEDGVSVSYREVAEEYNRQLASQTSLFADLANYKSVVKEGGLTLYAPTDHYVFVKHILLSFSDEQKALLEAEQTRLGTDEDAFKAYREKLAKEITAYEHVNGEDDTSSPAKTAQQIFAEVKAVMARYKNSPKYAERAFDELIYKYNTDPGIFTDKYKRYGYAVVYDESQEQDDEKFMEEFAAGARDFRDSGYKVGQMLDYYVVTEAGIHILYYAADPLSYETKSLNGYTSAGAYETVYETLEATLLSNKKTSVYELYIAAKVATANKDEWTTYYDKIISSYKKEIKKDIYG